MLGGLLENSNKELKARSQESTQLSDFGMTKNESSAFQKIALYYLSKILQLF